MSFYRENVVWESADGTWNRGFYYARQTGADPEWDVEYDYSTFEWVSCGHPDPEAARRSWTGANPGGHETIEYSVNPNECDRLDVMSLQCRY